MSETFIVESALGDLDAPVGSLRVAGRFAERAGNVSLLFRVLSHRRADTSVYTDALGGSLGGALVLRNTDILDSPRCTDAAFAAGAKAVLTAGEGSHDFPRFVHRIIVRTSGRLANPGGPHDDLLPIRDALGDRSSP